ncbi:phosphatase PAP2 family protein [Candidatus Woesearchaeota archaeon]|nr:phosphatase PAP2 family protein [Candidatus Woesearchaeota archaeon]
MKKINGTLAFALSFMIGILLFLVALNFDTQVSLFFKNIEFPVFDAALSIITNFGALFLLFIAIPSIILYKKNKKSVYLLLLVFIISIFLSFTIKLIVLRQRPMETFSHTAIGILNYPFLNILYYSFPSMHSMVVFSLLPILNRHLAKQKYFFISFTFLVAFSRIYFGFHFLSDVVFGAFAGYFVGNYLLKLHLKLKYGENKPNKPI